MTRHTRFSSALSLLLALSTTACGFEKSSSPQAAELSRVAEPAPALAAAAPGVAGMAATDADGRFAMAAQKADKPARDGRKIIRTGHLELLVDDYAPVRQEIDTILRTSGGLVANAQVGHSDGRVTEATLTLRVPVDGYEDLVARLGKLGTVMAESSAADDVTDQWVDVSARLANAKKLEGRLIELVATQAGNVTQLLEVERELARVREQVELFEGRLNLLADQTSLSTLNLRITTRVPYQAAITPTFGGDAKRALTSSWAGITDLARSLALGLIGFLPWLPLLAAAAYFLRRAYRRYLVPNKRSPASPSPGTM